MKRKLLSMLLVLCMVVSLLPMSALAAVTGGPSELESLKVGGTTIETVTGEGNDSSPYKATAYVADYNDVKLSIKLNEKDNAKLYYKAAESESITAGGNEITNEITLSQGSVTDQAITGMSDSQKYLQLKLDMEGSSSEYKYFVITVEKYASGSVAATLEGTLTQNTAVSGAKIKLVATTLQFAETPKKDDFVLEGAGSAGLQIDDSITWSDASNVELTLTGTPTASGDVTIKIKQAAFNPQPKDEVTATGSIQVAAEAKVVTLTADPSEVTAGAAVSQITLTAENGTFATATDNAGGNFAIEGEQKGTLAITGVNASSTTATLTLSGDAGSAGSFTIKVKKEAFEPDADEDVTVAITVTAAKEAATLKATPDTLYTEQSDGSFKLTLENATFVQAQVNTTNVTLEKGDNTALNINEVTYTDEHNINVKLSGQATQAGTIKFKVAAAAIQDAEAEMTVDITVASGKQPTVAPDIKGEEATVMCAEGNESATIELEGSKYDGEPVTVKVYKESPDTEEATGVTATYDKEKNAIKLTFDPALTEATTYKIAVQEGTDKAESTKVTVKVELYKAPVPTTKPNAEGGFDVIVCEEGNATATVAVSNAESYEQDVTVTLYDEQGSEKVEEGVTATYADDTMTLTFDPALEKVTKYQVSFTESGKSESEKVEIEVMPLTPAAEASETEVTATEGNTKAELTLSNADDYNTPAEASVAVKVYASKEDIESDREVQGVTATYAEGKISLTFSPALTENKTYQVTMTLTPKDGKAWAESEPLEVTVKYVPQTPTPIFDGTEEVVVTCNTKTTAEIPLKNASAYTGDTITVAVYKNAEGNEKAEKVTGKYADGKITLTFEEQLKTQTTYYVTLTDKDKSESEKLEVKVNPYVDDTKNGIESVTTTIDSASLSAENVSTEADTGKGVKTAIHYVFNLFEDQVSSLTSITLKLDSTKSTLSYKASNEALANDEAYTGETTPELSDGSVTISGLNFGTAKNLYVKVTSEAGESLYYLITVNALKLEAGEATTPVQIPETLQSALQDANLDETALDTDSQKVMDFAIASAIAKNTELTKQMENEGEKDNPDEGTVWKALKDANADVTGDTITYYYLPLLDMQVQRYNVENDDKIMMVDITPKYSVVASTADSWDQVKIKGQTGVQANEINAVELATAEEIADLANVTVEIVVPEGLAADGTTIYVQHGDDEYAVKVAEGKISLTVPHFSVFTLNTKASGKASIGGQVYATVQEAIDAVTNGGKVELTNAATAEDLEGLKTPTQLTNDQSFNLEKGTSALEEQIKQLKLAPSTASDKEYTATNDGNGKFTIKETQLYKVTISKTGTGEIVANKDAYKSGEQVILTVTSGTVDTITTTPDATPSTSDNGKTYKFMMPASDVTVNVTFKTTSNGGSGGGGGGGSSSATVTTPATTNGSYTVSDKNAKAGDTVKVTPKANKGYVVDQVTVTDKNGKAVSVKDNGDGTYSFVMPEKAAQPVTVKVTFKLDTSSAADKFTDVDKNAWYIDAVNYVVEKGLMEGTGATTFAPNATTTRAMIVTILYRLEGEPGVTKDVKFTDVASGQWYSDAINWAATNGIVNGYGENKFGPNDNVTREQMTAILYRYASYKGYNVSGQANLNGYTDANTINDWATNAMRWAVSAGLIQGTSNTTISPVDDSTRAQIATVLMRFCENIAK